MGDVKVVVGGDSTVVNPPRTVPGMNPTSPYLSLKVKVAVHLVMGGLTLCHSTAV